jgi:hypothetical protein
MMQAPRRKNIQHSDTQHNDTQHNGAQHNGFDCNTQHEQHSS